MKHSYAIRKPACVVKKNEYGEYEVPTQKGLTGADQIYFASDKEDAVDTAHYIHGHDVDVIFKSGTYTVEEA